MLKKITLLLASVSMTFGGLCCNTDTGVLSKYACRVEIVAVQWTLSCLFFIMEYYLYNIIGDSTDIVLQNTLVIIQRNAQKLF